MWRFALGGLPVYESLIATNFASDAQDDQSHAAPPFDAFLALRIDVRSGAKTMFGIDRRRPWRSPESIQ